MPTSAEAKTSNKKKLIYKKDSDGVFRLKKDGLFKSKEKQTKTLDNYFNELLDCSYKVKESEDEVDKRALSNLLINENKKQDKPSDIPNQSFTDLSSSISKYENMSYLKSGSYQFMRNLNTTSFVAGFVTALAIQAFSPMISYYLIAFYDIMKIGLVWLVILGGIAWYFGLLKDQDTKGLIDFYANSIDKITGSKLESPSQTSYLKTNREEQSKKLKSDTSSWTSEMQPDSLEELNKKQLDNTMTTVTPFYYNPPPKDSGFQSSPDLRLERKLSPTQSNRSSLGDVRGSPRQSVNFNDRRDSNTSFDSDNAGSTGNTSISSCSIGPNALKHIPPIPYESDELPFINKINLKSGAETKSSRSTNPSNAMNRVNSISSKKSVLGTRANYKKFLANVASNED